MNIWIDLANSPHVLFFKPVIERLKDRGHNITVTLRDFCQTIALANEFDINGEIIGNVNSNKFSGKGIEIVKRAISLSKFIKKKNIEIAVSHNSFSLIAAAKLLRIKTINIMDYEGQPLNHFSFRFANKVIVPESFPESYLRKFGASIEKTFKYNGFKEYVYLSYFKPDSSFVNIFKEKCHLSESWNEKENVIISVRTPANFAFYHRFKNILFDKLLTKLNNSNVTAVILPRYLDQKVEIKKKYKNLIVPDDSFDGANLIFFSDIVVSGGGTMNRESAVLGTPVYTIFAGVIPAVDKKLINMGRLKQIKCEQDIDKIKFEKKKKCNRIKNTELLDTIVNIITS